MSKLIDMTGMRFGKLLVTGQGERAPSGNIRWSCLCDCGGYALVDRGNLQRGRQVSCGCHGHSGLSRTHGHSLGARKTGTYNSWVAMRNRCENPDADNYAYYGGRGIKVCARWSAFETFLADMGERPQGTTIDRIDGNDGYRPNNCRWATKDVQASNKLSALTESEIQEACGRVEHGETRKAVAARLDVGQRAISRALLKGGYVARR